MIIMRELLSHNVREDIIVLMRELFQEKTREDIKEKTRELFREVSEKKTREVSEKTMRDITYALLHAPTAHRTLTYIYTTLSPGGDDGAEHVPRNETDAEADEKVAQGGAAGCWETRALGGSHRAGPP